MKIEELIPELNMETNCIEFKRFLNEGKDETSGNLKQIKWLKTLAAFANCEGGTMYIGIDDENHNVMPLDAKTTDEQILLVRREMETRLIPSISPYISTISVKESDETKYVIAIKVGHSSRLPVMVKDRGSYTTYIRKYGYTEIATPEDIKSLILKDEQTSFDVIPVDEKYDPGNFKLIKSEYENNHNGSILLDKTLQLKGFYDANGFLRNGSLLFKDSCVDEKTNISIVKWPGIDRGSSNLLSLIKMNGPISKIIHDATDKIMLLTTNGIAKTEEGEKPLFSYPRRSVLEGIANAYAHRNYWMIGTQIQVDIFLDRMEITSPGSLLSGKMLKKEKDISSIIPQHRNKLIADILALLGLIQGLGTGFDKIEQDYISANDQHKPFINSTDESFTLVLPDLTYANGVLDSNSICPNIYIENGHLTKKETMILSYCYMEKRTIAQIANYLGISVSTYLKEKIVGELVKKGLLIASEERPAKYISSRSLVKIYA